MNVAHKVVIASTAAVFFMPDEPSAISEADNNAVFHNGYRSQIYGIGTLNPLTGSIEKPILYIIA